MKRGRLLTVKKQLSEARLLNERYERKFKSLNFAFWACAIGWLLTLVALGLSLSVVTDKPHSYGAEPYFGWGYYDRGDCNGRFTP